MPIYETFFQSLEERGWAVADDTIPKDLPGRLYDECRDLWRTGRFRPAQVGRNSRQTYRGDIRGDSICWLEPDSAGAASLEFLRSEEHTSELQSLMRISYAVFCLKKKTPNRHDLTHLKPTLL